MNWLMTVFSAGQVERCHTMKHHGSYSLAEHSYYCVMTARHIVLLDAGTIFPDSVRIEAITDYLLIHDLHELESGDIPHPFKRDNEPLQFFLKHNAEDWRSANVPEQFNYQLTELEYAVAKVADYLELMRWCGSQSRLGSRNSVKVMYEKAKDIVGKNVVICEDVIDELEVGHIVNLLDGVMYDGQ